MKGCLFVEENVSSDDISKAAVDEAPSSRKFLRFNFLIFWRRYL